MKNSMLLITVTCIFFCALTLPVHGDDSWALRFSDNFNRSTLHAAQIDGEPPNWQIHGGNWHIDGGVLHGDSDAIILLLWRFPGDQRLEFDAMAEDNVCDLSAILGTGEQASPNDGYFFGFGSVNNTLSKLLAKGREVVRSDTRIVPGKVHRVICQREGGRLTHIIDGKVVAIYEDDQPLTGPGHDAISLYIFGTGMIDNVRIYTKAAAPLPKRITPPALDPAQPVTQPIDDPLFEELFGDEPGPTRFFSYGGKYDARSATRTGADDHRETAKRFGFRFVHDEQLDEAAQHNFITYGKMSEPGNASRGIVTHSRWVEPPPPQNLVYLSDKTFPMVFGDQGWMMDPRYQDYLIREIQDRAKEGDRWGIHMFDEIWTSYVLRTVPREKWYIQMIEADHEIRKKYGFGKYGMPDSHENGDPFERLAYRRWASDKLTATFAASRRAAKAINPELTLIGPSGESNGYAADIEAWGSYFDIMGGQCGSGPTSAFFDSVRVGAVTKLYDDITDTSAWMMVHACVRHAARRQPEDIREMYSQVFRNGGRGLWLMHSEFYEAELEDAMFAEPARWRAMLQLTETISKMRLPKLPPADCAILWSSDTMLTTLWGQFWGEDNDRVLSTYAILGPLLRSWFHFVGDRQIDRGTRDLSDYKVLYIPFSTYQRASVIEKIDQYVKAGGTVVCTDTDAFTWDINGEKHGQRWERLSGIRKITRRKTVTPFITLTPYPLKLTKPLSMTSIAPGWNIKLLNEDVQILAAYEDGSPAVTLHPYGKGKVIYFAADPLYASDYFRIPKPLFSMAHPEDKKSLVAPGAPIVQFFQAVQASAAAQMGCDIWRFKLPPFAKDPWQKQKGICLTNNYVFDVNEPLLEPNNLPTGGTYVYSRPPNGIADNGQSGKPVSFKEGKLTNRLAAYESRQRFGPRKRNFEKITPNWIVSWTDRIPVSITFDLKSDHSLKHLRIFYSGTIPALQVSGSRDEKQWEKLSLAAEESAGSDVKDVIIFLSGEYRHVRLDFAERRAGKVFELCEVEIWESEK